MSWTSTVKELIYHVDHLFYEQKNITKWMKSNNVVGGVAVSKQKLVTFSR